ncbi:MAG TPA: FAD-linked oxidase C-terminal domain-containing protein [Chloroflexia bacterium]|nr:FAD-linked oxidase C-terminal domain-containing protein [Chloroflexia bacterium]
MASRTRSTERELHTPVIQALRDVMPAQQVHATVEDLAVFGYDGTWGLHRPDAVVSPTTTEQVAAIVKVAQRLGVPVVPRGGGTGLAGGTVPVEGGIVVNMTRMNRVLELDRLNMVAVVQPGIVTAQLQAEVEKVGLFYPPDPQSLRQCTIGGNVATTAGGPRCLKYGTTKDYVLGLQVVLADGRVIRTGGKMMKVQTGYNLTGLFVGSEGTLGIITEVTLRLIAKPRYRGTVMAVFNRLDDAAQTVNRILQSGLVPLALEMMDNSCIRAVEAYKPFGLPLHAETILLIDQDGNDSRVVQEELSEIAALSREGGAIEVRQAATSAEGDALWAARRAVSPAISRLRPNKLGEDISVPRAHIPEMVRKVTEIGLRHRLPIPLFGHIGDGNLHPNILCDLRDAEEMERVQAAAREIFEAAVSLGGTLSGEHGIGTLKREFLSESLDAATIEMMRRIKWALDPHNRLNPGKVFPIPLEEIRG